MFHAADPGGACLRAGIGELMEQINNNKKMKTERIPGNPVTGGSYAVFFIGNQYPADARRGNRSWPCSVGRYQSFRGLRQRQSRR